MDDLLAARLQMAVSLGFHIIFACIGMAMPFLMAIAEWKWLRKKEKVYLDLAKSWAKGVAIFFATGAVSGTVLSFELGLLWPEFMRHAGPIFGMPFSWEGAAFFMEAAALGLFLYGWDKVKPWIHWASGVVVGISGLLSGIFVVAANGWMNAPSGFDWVDGKAVNIDPVKAMFNEAWFSQALHMSIAAFFATAFAVAGLHALLYLRGKAKSFHLAAIRIALPVAIIAAILQPISGDISAKDVAKRQPVKLAAMEAHYHTEKRAGLIIGGIPDSEQQSVDWALKIPGMLSWLAFGDFNAEVKGLAEFPRELWPPVLIVHMAFQIMVGIGFSLLTVGLLYVLLVVLKKRPLEKKWFLILLGICSPLGFIAVEAGWTVTEVGRQPWIVYGILKTKDTLTPMPGLVWSLLFVTLVYTLLTIVLIWLMKHHIHKIEIEYEKAAKEGVV